MEVGKILSAIHDVRYLNQSWILLQALALARCKIILPYSINNCTLLCCRIFHSHTTDNKLFHLFYCIFYKLEQLPCQSCRDILGQSTLQLSLILSIWSSSFVLHFTMFLMIASECQWLVTGSQYSLFLLDPFPECSLDISVELNSWWF